MHLIRAAQLQNNASVISKLQLFEAYNSEIRDITAEY